MIYQVTHTGYTKPFNFVSTLIHENSTEEVILFADKNPNKPPKKKQKKKKKAVAEPPIKRKRKKRKEKAA